MMIGLAIIPFLLLSISNDVCLGMEPLSDKPSGGDTVYRYNMDQKKTSYWYESMAKELNEALAIRYRTQRAKNVIFFLGDGMSITTLTAARIFKGQTLMKTSGEEGKLFFEGFPHSALIKTYNVDRQVPDSAGTATAFLTGVKGNYYTVGVNGMVNQTNTNCNEIKENSVSSIMKWAQDAGKRTGIVTTTRITHATPAGSYAHVANRDWEADSDLPSSLDPQCKDIARQLIEDEPGTGFKVILGGGMGNFYPTSWVNKKTNQTGKRKDEQDLVEKWIKMRQSSGLKRDQYQFVNTTGQLKEVSADKKLEYLFGLFNQSHVSYDIERDETDDGEPSLAQMTEAAINVLNRPDDSQGFVLLVEGGRIDHAHHDNMASMALRETVAFDKAIEKALSMVSVEDTLILVTADHAHTLTMNGYPVRGQDIRGVSSSNDTNGVPFTTLMYGNGPGHHDIRVSPDDRYAPRYAHESAVKLVESNHGGEDVAVYAVGPFAHLFHTLHEQPYIAHVIGYSACIGVYNKTDHCTHPSYRPGLGPMSASNPIIPSLQHMAYPMLPPLYQYFSQRYVGPRF